MYYIFSWRVYKIVRTIFTVFPAAIYSTILIFIKQSSKTKIDITPKLIKLLITDAWRTVSHFRAHIGIDMDRVSFYTTSRMYALWLFIDPQSKWANDARKSASA